MMFVFGRNPKSLGDALMIVYLFVSILVSDNCVSARDTTILAFEESAR